MHEGQRACGGQDVGPRERGRGLVRIAIGQPGELPRAAQRSAVAEYRDGACQCCRVLPEAGHAQDD
jgi:hypothetical protein